MLFVKKFKIFVLMTCLVLVGQGFAVDSEAWDGTSMTEPSTESIDGKVYYKIYTAAELAWFAAQTNSGDNNPFLSANAKLMADLDMGGELWTPIAVGDGNDKKRVFMGVFDGNGHSISNLYISAEELIAKYAVSHKDSIFYAQNLGFIGCLKGKVTNLNLINIEVHGYGKGGLGQNNNLVDKPISIGTVVGWQSDNNSLIDGCTASGVVVTSGDGQAVGGIVGNIGSGTISNCISTVSIKASGLAYVGGIVGYTKKVDGTKASISSCVYAGTELSAEGSAVVGDKTYNSAAGAILGNQYNATDVTFTSVFYDEALGSGVGVITGSKIKGSITPTSNVNSDSVVCALNDSQMVDGECPKDSPWSVGESSVSLNGSDGFTVTFNAKSGAFPDGAKKKKVILKDRIITPEEISAPVHADSVFAGWSLSPIATEPDDDLGSVSGAATVYAVWYPIYTITFSAAPGTYADGETIVKMVKVAKGDMISITGMDVPTSYVKEGTRLYFTGWSDQQKEFEKDYVITDSDTLHLDGLVATGDTTFYAAWTKARTFTVTYNANGHGKTKVDFVNVEKGEYLTEPPAPTPDDGYEYSGWCLDTTACNTDTYFAFKTTAIDTNYVLYADWNPIAYTITYNLDGGTNNAGNPTSYTIENASIVLQNPVKEGFNFKGWFYDDHFNEIAKQITSGSTGNKAVYAKWEEKTYTIAYMAGSGAVGSISPAQKGYGMSITLAGGGHYTLDGYTQDGWATEDGGEWVYALGGTYSTNADTTLYPHWIEGNVEVSSYGAVTIYTYAANDVRAVINGDYTGSETVEITGNGIEVNSVTLDRTFNVNKISTLYVPFEIDANAIDGASVYKFKTVVWNEEEDRWKFKVTTTETVKPNTPYVLLPSEELVSFNINGTVTLNTETEGEEASNGQWDFLGTYSYISFVFDKDNPVYLFANQERDGAKLGQFVRIGTGAFTNPMRAYLVYHKNITPNKSIHGNLGGNVSLPNEIDIEVENENGIVVETGKLNTVTGEVRMDRWFDLKGRRLNSKPSVKGTYYKNGKKVIIK